MLDILILIIFYAGFKYGAKHRKYLVQLKKEMQSVIFNRNDIHIGNPGELIYTRQIDDNGIITITHSKTFKLKGDTTTFFLDNIRIDKSLYRNKKEFKLDQNDKLLITYTGGDGYISLVSDYKINNIIFKYDALSYLVNFIFMGLWCIISYILVHLDYIDVYTFLKVLIALVSPIVGRLV